jgi:hypothetical protein
MMQTTLVRNGTAPILDLFGPTVEMLTSPEDY